MSPTSYQLLHPAMSSRALRERDNKDTPKFHSTKSHFNINFGRRSDAMYLRC